MILINLLPHREERRKRRKAAFFAGMGIAAIAGLVIVGVWYLLVQQMIAAQQDRNQFLKTEIAKLEVQIKDIAMLKAEIEALKARQKAVENLQTDRNIPVHVLNDLVRQTPEGIYFNSVKQSGQVLVLNGIAQTNERVSELLRNLAYDAEWLTKPELIEIRATNAQTTAGSRKRLFDFSLRVAIKRPPDAKAVEAQAAPKSGAAKADKKS